VALRERTEVLQEDMWGMVEAEVVLMVEEGIMAAVEVVEEVEEAVEVGAAEEVVAVVAKGLPSNNKSVFANVIK
jgi:hypothetical protein